MERADIQRVFNRDFRKLLGLDIFALADNLVFLSKQNFWTDIIPEEVVTPLKILAINLYHIIEDFLIYREEKFPNPLDQYIYIYENKELILNMLSCSMETENPFDDPVSYRTAKNLYIRFNNLFLSILTCGNTHKFDPELITRTLEREKDEHD